MLFGIYDTLDSQGIWHHLGSGTHNGKAEIKWEVRRVMDSERGRDRVAVSRLQVLNHHLGLEIVLIQIAVYEHM